jgi:acyl-CoA synthetase (AMP-forming)/AMP-acid ligase II
MLESDTLMENVLGIAQAAPEKVFARLLYAQGRDRTILYGELLQNAGRYADFFHARGVKKGDVVILILPHGPDLLYSFVGAMLYGAIPSIFASPSPKISAEEYGKTLPLLLEVCGTRFVVASPDLAQTIKAVGAGLGEIEILEADGYLKYPGSFRRPASYDPGAIVLLQHSSGTTGLKKGVALSNLSVMRQLRNYAGALNLGQDDKIVSWLPLYHDMGLVACCILPLVCGIPVAMLSPFDWVANPVLLLRAIHREGGTLCWQPNFAYNFLAARVREEDLEGLDLSSMRAFINCAEPVSARSHQVFLEKFRRYGVREEALNACYAMAENTFAVTQGDMRRPALIEKLDGRPVVSSGRAIPGNEVRIVDERRQTLPERRVGEIAVKSDSMLTEYYHRPDLTRRALENGWYFTGDLGYLAGGELFVTGRGKDMIIVAGKNIYPQDLEEIASSVPGVHPGRTAAFGVYNEELGTEDVVILAESDAEEKAEKMNIRLAIAQAVRMRLECVANDIIVVPHMWLLKSSSGKISRSANRAKYLRDRGQKDVLV